jgi:PadR family transcriptional regulator, regulatory protein PadR
MTTPKADVPAGSLALMILRTLDALGSLHGYRLARRIEQISGNALALNQGTLYPALLKLEQMGWITAKWGATDTGRRAKFYAISRAGKKQLQKETETWTRGAAIVARFMRGDLT